MPRTPAHDRVGFGAIENPPEPLGRKRRGPSFATAGPPCKQPLLYLSAPRCPTTVIAGKIKRIHFQKEQKSFSAYPKHPAFMQPVCTAVSTPCYVGRSLAGHPRCIRVGNDYGKMRLYTPIRSKTTALLLCARHHSAQRECSSPLRRGDESAGKRSHRNRSSSPE